eukprot:UC4_evm1s135
MVCPATTFHFAFLALLFYGVIEGVQAGPYEECRRKCPTGGATPFNELNRWDAFDCGNMKFISVSYGNRYGSTFQGFRYKQECLDACHAKYDCTGVCCPEGQYCVSKGQGKCGVDFECVEKPAVTDTAYNCSKAVDDLGRSICETRLTLCDIPNIRRGCEFSCNGCLYPEKAPAVTDTAYNCSKAVDDLGRSICETRLTLCDIPNIRRGCEFSCNGCLYPEKAPAVTDTAYNCSKAVDDLGRSICETRLTLCDIPNIRRGCEFSCNGCLYPEKATIDSSTDSSTMAPAMIAIISMSSIVLIFFIYLWRRRMNKSPFFKVENKKRQSVPQEPYMPPRGDNEDPPGLHPESYFVVKPGPSPYQPSEADKANLPCQSRYHLYGEPDNIYENPPGLQADGEDLPPGLDVNI